MRKGFILVLLLGLLFSLQCSTLANQYTARLSYHDFFLEVHESNWINSPPIVAIGYTWKELSLSYAPLYSDLLVSPGEHLSLDYVYQRERYSPYARMIVDHYRRSDQGGVSVAGGVAIKATDFCQVRVGMMKGWLSGSWVPQISLMVEL